MSCPHASSGCNYPEGDCAGACQKAPRCGFCSFEIATCEAPCASWEQADRCDAFQAMEALKAAAVRFGQREPS